MSSNDHAKLHYKYDNLRIICLPAQFDTTTSATFITWTWLGDTDEFGINTIFKQYEFKINLNFLHRQLSLAQPCATDSKFMIKEV